MAKSHEYELNSAPIVPQVNRTGTESSDADEENRNLRILSGSNFPSLLFLFEIEMGIWNPRKQNQLDLRNWRQISAKIFSPFDTKIAIFIQKKAQTGISRPNGLGELLGSSLDPHIILSSNNMFTATLPLN